MGKLVIPLKQHTSMIHFQHNILGVSLRGSEIKSKVIKYLVDLPNYYSTLSNEQKEKINEIERIVNKNRSYPFQCIVRDNTKTQNPENRKKEDIGKKAQSKYLGAKIKTLYFGERTNLIRLEYIDVVFQSNDVELLKLIELSMPIMLAFENFGTRQNKGFGSFSLSPDYKPSDNLSVHLEELNTFINNMESVYKKNNSNVHLLTIKTIKDNEVKPDDEISAKITDESAANPVNELAVFHNIYYLYNTLKGGINEDKNGKNPEKNPEKNHEKYSKSLLFKYLRNTNRNLIWEKRYFKQVLAKDDPKFDNQLKYIRGLLGFTTDFLFKETHIRDRNNQIIGEKPARMDFEDYNDDGIIDILSDTTFKVDHNVDNFERSKQKENQIERAASPIFFKPIKCEGRFNVYIITKPELYNNGKIDIRNQTFYFKKMPGGEKLLEEPIPTMRNFDLNKFIYWAIKELNNQNSVFTSKIIKDITKDNEIKEVK